MFSISLHLNNLSNMVLLAGPTFIRPTGSGLEFWLVFRGYSLLWQNAQRICEHYGGNLATSGMRDSELRKYEFTNDVIAGGWETRKCLRKQEKCQNT